MRQTARHLVDFDIECYRGLRDLYLRDLNEINILTGNNNSGKTSVLELISSLDEPMIISTWIKMCRLDGHGNYYSGILNLFPADSESLELRYSYSKEAGENASIGVMAEIHKVRILESEMDRINGFETGEVYGKGKNYVDAKSLNLAMVKNGEMVRKYALYDFQMRIPMKINRKMPFPVIYVSPGEHTNGTFYMDDVMENSGLYQDMLTILREFDDSIINITASDSGNRQATGYMIVSTQHKKAMPLSVYGDGMKKALVLLAAVVKAKNGILLLDEFETAIHTSAMDSIFSWILQSAQRLNVQVFLSSHSLEAIGKVLRCDSGLQDKINIYTLYNKEGKNLVRKMNCMEAIKAQDDWGVELR